jgi:hypothetical protein
MTALPDRLSIDPASPFYNEIYKRVGVRFAGQEKTNVYEYCVSERWVRVIAGNARGRDGKLLTITLRDGTVEPYIRELSQAKVFKADGGTT